MCPCIPPPGLKCQAASQCRRCLAEVRLRWGSRETSLFRLAAGGIRVYYILDTGCGDGHLLDAFGATSFPIRSFVRFQARHASPASELRQLLASWENLRTFGEQRFLLGFCWQLRLLGGFVMRSCWIRGGLLRALCISPQQHPYQGVHTQEAHPFLA